MQLNQYIDHTNLKPTATEADILKLCAEAAKYHFASVCVNPLWVATAKQALAGTDVRVCTVIGFPLGATTTAVKAYEVSDALQHGCDEFDMVINIGALRAGQLDVVRKDMRAVVKAAKGHTVKIILEVGLLNKEETVTAVKLACRSKAPYIKTGTGFAGDGVTVDQVRTIKRHLIKKFNTKIKAAGGIRNYETAMALIEAGAERLGTSSGVSIMRGASEK